MSVEAIAAEGGAARTRFSRYLSEPTDDGVRGSDILLFDWSEHTAPDLESVFPQMLGSTTLISGGVLGIFWELYGLEAGRVFDVSITIGPTSTGLLRRIGQALRVVDAAGRGAVGWSDGADPDGDGIVSRVLQLDFGDLREGEYLLAIDVAPASGEAIRLERRVQVVLE
jgi:hypothetical protein